MAFWVPILVGIMAWAFSTYLVIRPIIGQRVKLICAEAAIPLWVMMVGAIGIVVGLALYGPKLIRTVGTEITELDQWL